MQKALVGYVRNKNQVEVKGAGNKIHTINQNIRSNNIPRNPTNSNSPSLSNKNTNNSPFNKKKSYNFDFNKPGSNKNNLAESRSVSTRNYNFGRFNNNANNYQQLTESRS
jgi:hypothetical protein